MFRLNFNLLEQLSEEENISKLRQGFFFLLDQLKTNLDLDIIDSEIKLIYNENVKGKVFKGNNVLDLGATRSFQDNFLIIELNRDFKKYFPIILLREALMCFIPANLKENSGIKIIVNQMVEIILQKLDIIDEWGQIIREQVVDYDFLTSDFDKFEKFLKLKDDETTESAVKFFFGYIRKNILLIDDKTRDFHDSILKNFYVKTSKSLYNDEMIETLRVLIKIFYKVKTYSALLEYQNHFKDFKKKKEILTNLSLRKFSSNVQWINKFSYIAPSYKINWNSVDLRTMYCYLKFNPELPKKKINLIIEDLPFFLMSKSSANNFSVEVSGWFIYPSKYQKDLKYLFQRFEDSGYLVNKICILHKIKRNFLNLNYFREFYNKGRIINPNHSQYNQKYEIEFETEYRSGNEIKKLSILDFLIINRVTFWSVDGFSFERRAKTLKTIKSDLIHEILSQRALIGKLKRSIKSIHENSELESQFLNFLESNKKFGFFYIKEFLKDLVSILNLMKRILINSPKIKDILQLDEIIKQTHISRNIKENILLNKESLKKILYRDFLSIYFENKNRFNIELNTYQLYSEIFKSCYMLKIFDLNAIGSIIKNKSILNKIFSVKERKLKEIYESYKIKKITINDIENGLDSLIGFNPPVIQPLLINTINTSDFAKYFIEIIIKDNSETQDIMNQIKKFFPRVIQSLGYDLFTNEKLNLIEIYAPNLNSNEKELFISILFNLFRQNIVSFKRFFYDGFIKSFRVRDFYDLGKKEFFYTKDLFEEYSAYVQNIMGDKINPFKEGSGGNQSAFWSSKKNINKLTEQVNDRLSREQVKFDISMLRELSNLNSNLPKILLDSEKFKEIKNKGYFKRYIKSIKFEPTYHYFGLGQYYLYIRPINMLDIDFKLLLNNTFNKILYPAFIDEVQSLFIKFIFPYHNPNMSYINWLAKSKMNVSEYCRFYIKKFYPIVHFNRNLEPHGWDLDANHFETYIQKILFDSKYKENIPEIKEYNIGTKENSDFYGPKSTNFRNLVNITDLKAFDLKSVLGSRNYSLIEKISKLIKNDIIIPHIRLKNLDFQEKIYIILPNINKKLNDKIIKIFNFFNYGFIYEIEGEYFIYSFPKEIKFENGLMIKLYLPQMELSDFQRVFDKLFQFLKIDKYLILNDLVDGTNLIKNIFGNLNFLDSYNPLKNLRWNEKDKIWMNNKLFNEKFEPIYPDLIQKEEN